jgi:hypothetical protein
MQRFRSAETEEEMYGYLDKKGRKKDCKEGEEERRYGDPSSERGKRRSIKIMVGRRKGQVWRDWLLYLDNRMVDEGTLGGFR